MEEVSVLIVTHNRGHLISETISSVLKQTLLPSEIIIIDDGSTDNTHAVVASFNNMRIKYFFYPRIGRLTRLRNLAVKKSSKPFIAFIDSDDLWHSEKLKMCVDACKTGALVCVADCIEFTGEGVSASSRGYMFNEGRPIDIKREILVNNVPLTYGSNIFLHRQVFDHIKGFDESMFHGDHDFFCRALYHSKNIYVPHVLSYIRRHDANMSNNHQKYDPSPLIEYDRTLLKIKERGLLAPNDFKNTRSNNLQSLASYAMANGRLAHSVSYLARAIAVKPAVRPIGKYLKKLLLTFCSKLSTLIVAKK